METQVAGLSAHYDDGFVVGARVQNKKTGRIGLIVGRQPGSAFVRVVTEKLVPRKGAITNRDIVHWSIFNLVVFKD